jgi:hypothetical protein
METPTPSRRWFQFSLLAVFVAVALIAVAVRVGMDYHALLSDIDGAWMGTGVQQGLTIQFERKVLTLTNRAGSLDSAFEVYPANHSIRIISDRGEQVGLYRLEGDVLELRVSSIGKPAPRSIEPSSKEPGTVYYYLKRQSR